jgi:potassium-transporting ATPase KdpC subunit
MLSSHLRPALVSLTFFTMLTGLIYPLAITGAAQILFPVQANGSLIERQGKVVGSSLVGQPFTQERYFHSRPSAAGEGYDAAASSGSNLGPTSARLAERIKQDTDALRSQGIDGNIPADKVTASASGLDPHISLENASLQIKRIALARGWTETQVRDVLMKHTEHQPFSSVYVNVLNVNMALDDLK